jgi:hypothetical protein
MRLGRIDLNAYDVIDSNKLERDLSEKPVPSFSHPSLDARAPHQGERAR